MRISKDRTDQAVEATSGNAPKAGLDFAAVVGKRQKAKGKRQKAKGKRQKAKGKRQKAKGNVPFPHSPLPTPHSPFLFF
jgi:hypothetical protein